MSHHNSSSNSESATSPQRIAYSKNGMIATAHECATQAGKSILEKGGNAIDAAITAAFTLRVCEPMSSGLGGQTMALIYLKQKGNTIALDGSSRAPNRATLDMLSKQEMRRGHRATTVPSTPAVLDYLRNQYGTLPLEHLLKPAIQVAKGGYIISKLQHHLIERSCKILCENSGGSLFLRNGNSLPFGYLFKQQRLANTLEHISNKGIDDFYKGDIANKICEDMKQNNGLIQMDDLANIPLPIERRPLSTKFLGKRVFTFPPPGAGRMLIEMINIIQKLPHRSINIKLPEGAVTLAKVIMQANIDRRDRPFDPNYYPQIDDEHMLNHKYAKKVAKRIRRELEGEGETTHLSVIDREGNIVSLTQSIERVFGSGAASPELGFLYNNYMSAFEYEDMSHPYYLRPNGVPWASVAPTIVFHGQHPWCALGSPGSERIVTAILQVLLRLKKENHMEAIMAPRLHCSLNGTVSLEASRMRNDILRALERSGFKLDIRDPFSFYLGSVQAVFHEKDGYIGIADLRRDGSADGP
jgi:gamma-glutamyltranspeptidase/glutathione hydrolase